VDEPIRILVIEDEPDLARTIEYGLRQAGFDPLTAHTAREGLALARSAAPALITLDLMLPDMQGTDVFRALRTAPATAHTPVIVVSARAEEIDRIVLLELGAEDYVTKPFSVRELILRVRARLRERGAATEPADARIHFGVLEIDTAAHVVAVEGRLLQLTRFEYQLLLVLHSTRGRVQSREGLLRAVAPDRTGLGPRNIDSHVKRLRGKLGAAANYLHTVRGFGYRFASTPQDLWDGSSEGGA
jgi:two-component system phosphate regulon response regulator PhoB